MSGTNKELLDIKNKLAGEHGWLNWEAIPASTFKDELWDIVCERFATEKAKELFTRSEVESCIKDSLQSAADNVRVPVTLKEIKDWAASNRIEGYDLHWSVDKYSITDPKNIKIK